jgi:hypothetical protein
MGLERVHITAEYRIHACRPACGQAAAEFIRDAANHDIPVFPADSPAFAATKGATKPTMYTTREMAANPIPEPRPKPANPLVLLPSRP